MLTFNIVAIIILTIAFSIDVFLILQQKPKPAVVNDLKSNFLLGMLVLLTGAFMKTVELSAFSLVYNFAIIKPGMSVWLWIVGIFACDFVHYVYHWLEHGTQLFWAAHVTHHSSEHFNMSTGWRTSFLQLFYRFIFFAPLCLLGIPPVMILFLESATAMWNFLLHTESIKKLPLFDWWLNTPSNHRVHHATNEQYLDKNMGGIFMIYDHLFGTYAKENETPVYGITHKIHSHKPATILFHEFNSIRKELPLRKGMMAKARYLLSAPQ